MKQKIWKTVFVTASVVITIAAFTVMVRTGKPVLPSTYKEEIKKEVRLQMELLRKDIEDSRVAKR
jgi:hypothetical protein